MTTLDEVYGGREGSRMNGLNHPLDPDCQHGQEGTCYRCEPAMYPYARELHAVSDYKSWTQLRARTPIRICSVALCEAPAGAGRGMCAVHYGKASKELRDWRLKNAGRREILRRRS